MAILIMPNLQLGPEHSLGLAWELAAFEFGVSEGATSVIFTGPPSLLAARPRTKPTSFSSPHSPASMTASLSPKATSVAKPPASWRAFLSSFGFMAP